MTKTGVTPKVALLVLDRDGDTCCVNLTHTGARPKDQLHHRLPRQMGGSKGREVHTAANLLCLCSDCHAYIESHREEAYAHGWLVHRGDDPCMTAVLWRGIWVRLLEDGAVLKTHSPGQS